MSEDIYTIDGFKPETGEWENVFISFSDLDDQWACLCTFPHNDGGTISNTRMRSLALLGAAVVLAHNGTLREALLPHGVPEWIRNEIKRVIPEEEE